MCSSNRLLSAANNHTPCQSRSTWLTGLGFSRFFICRILSKILVAERIYSQISSGAQHFGGTNTNAGHSFASTYIYIFACNFLLLYTCNAPPRSPLHREMVIARWPEQRWTSNGPETRGHNWLVSCGGHIANACILCLCYTHKKNQREPKTLP